MSMIIFFKTTQLKIKQKNHTGSSVGGNKGLSSKPKQTK